MKRSDRKPLLVFSSAALCDRLTTTRGGPHGADGAVHTWPVRKASLARNRAGRECDGLLNRAFETVEKPRATERFGWAAAAALALLFGVQVFFGSAKESLTWDEPGYIASGYVNWTEGDYRLAPDHPPLMQKLQALPLLALDVKAPPLSSLRWGRDPNPRATYGREFFFASGNDPVRLARWARAPVLLLGMLLVLCVYGFARELMRPEAALLACMLAALDPNLIAHAKLATEDLGCSAFMLAALWTFWRWLRRPGAGRAAACGAVTGLALLSKYTALLVVPIGAVLGLVFWIQDRPEWRWKACLRDAVVVAGVACVSINFAYGPGFHLDEYVAGIELIYPDVNPNYRFYFWGAVSDQPFWYYALASLVIKTPLSVGFLLALSVLAMTGSSRARHAAVVWGVPIAALLCASLFDITSPGVRRILPAVPFLLLCAGLGLEASQNAAIRTGAWLGVAASAATALFIYPHHLSYMNALFGGPERGPYVLDESNIDWGQDLPALAEWQAEHLPDEPLALHYFGTADPAAYGVRAVAFDPREALRPKPGVKAISAHFLVGFRKFQALTGEDADWLSKYEPIAKAGYSIFIYRFPESVGPGRSSESE